MDQIDIFDYMYSTYKIKKPIRLIELFAGIGSQAKALERLGANFEHYRVVEFDKYAIKSYNAIHGTDFETNDITKIHAIDLCIEDTESYEYIMTYSFPCQDLSLAGKQRGMTKGSGTRSGLLWEVERILDECVELPQILLMENVPQVIGQKNIDDFHKWQLKLESLGYTNFVKLLNAKNYGIPQNRERCFMISLLGEYNYNFPQPFELKLKLKDMLQDDVDEKYYLSEKMIKYISDTGTKNFKNADCKINLDISRPLTTAQNKRSGTTNYLSDNLPNNYDLNEFIQVSRKYGIFDTDKSKHQAGSVYDVNGISPTLDTMQGGYRQPCIEEQNCFVGNKYKEFVEENDYIPNMFNPYNKNEINDIAPTQTTQCGNTGSSGAVLINDNNKEDCLLIKEKTKRGYKEAYEGDGVYINRPNQKRGCVQRNMIQTLKTSGNDVGVVSKYLRIRKLTPKECFRLMGFDDIDFEKKCKKKKKVNSDAQLYKQAGNSIVVNVLQEIFRQLL